ncbi:hypothetical protein Nmel_004111, partial [Mimus melanotis]
QITPAIGIRQKTSEKNFEEQLKAYNYLIEKQKEQLEGMVRLRKIKQKPLKEDSKRSRRAGLNCWGHFSQSDQVNRGILWPGECSQLNQQGAVALTWQVASFSCESSYLHPKRDDDPESHHAQYPSQHVPWRVGHTDRHLDLSDGDYASGKPSGTEKTSLLGNKADHHQENKIFKQFQVNKMSPVAQEALILVLELLI